MELAESGKPYDAIIIFLANPTGETMKSINSTELAWLIPLLLLMLAGCAGNNLGQLQKSADSGNAQAQYEMGFKYESGIDVPRDLQQAISLYRLSAQQGNQSAKNCLARLGADIPSKDQATALRETQVETPPKQPIEDRVTNLPDAQHELIKAASTQKPAKKSRKHNKSSEHSGKPNADFTNVEVDNGFRRWSTAWWMDQYIPNSAQVRDGGFKNGTYVVNGEFSFAREGQTHTIPFAAAFSQISKGYRLSNLCYNDITSGMTDCIDPTDQAIAQAQSKSFLGQVLAEGLVGMLESSDDADNADEEYYNKIDMQNRIADQYKW